MRIYWLPSLFVLLLLAPAYHHASLAADPPGDGGEDVLAGHSVHGEAFNEGPRQAAYLMAGMGDSVFAVTTENPLTQRFISQGVAQLHGFWYYEAERSFRQAAVLDPGCAMSYWGMSLANVENRPRARDFIAQAVQRLEGTTPRERLYIEAWQRYCRDEDEKGKTIDKKTRAETYSRDLEKIVLEHPADLDAQAWLALQLWQNERAGLPIVSHVAINSVLQDVFDGNPMHPAHHYRIHLWDRADAKQALQSAALCGPSLPGIAHMWHMPGHIYSKLNRYQDAAWQQEASARVDHAHMMRDRVLPDQIHNFAHNNEWLIRNLLKVGRIDDALSLAKNMLELPRHPKYNTLSKGSTKYGRERLWLALTSYRLWPELIELSETMYLEPTSDPALQRERTRNLAVAFALNNQPAAAEEELAQLETLLSNTQREQKQLEAEIASANERPPAPKKAAAKTPATDKSPAAAKTQADQQKAEANRKRREKERSDKLKQLQETHKQLEKAIAAVKAAQAAGRQEWQTALEAWDKSDLSDKLLKAEWLAAADQLDEALELVGKQIDSSPGEVLPLAVKAWLQYHYGDANQARATMELVRNLAAVADLQTPLLDRLAPLAAELGLPAPWAATAQTASDVGPRPALDSLGPFRWQPYMAPDFAATNLQQETLRLRDLSGKPTLVIFYLGFGCLHCVEQLHEFSPRAEQFRESGIEILAISSEELPSLKAALETYAKPIHIPLHADPELAAFKAFRCYDDFEQQPLHGTFLIDPTGRVLWQDISFEPFMDVDFALQESHRLLKLAGFGSALAPPKPQKLISVGE